MEICGICGKRFKNTLAVKQKIQQQISQIFANLNLWKSAESALKDLKVHQRQNKKSTTNFTKLRKSKSVKICAICVKRFKSTSAIKQKNQSQISQIYANQNLWNLWLYDLRTT